MRQPSYRYRLHGCTPDQASCVRMLPALVPGARVYPKEDHAEPEDVYVSWHGAYLVEAWLASWYVGFTGIPRDGADRISAWWNGGQEEADRAFRDVAGCFTPRVLEKATPYQRFIPYVAARSPIAWLNWPTGTGKTLGGFLAIAAAPAGAAIIVTPAKAKYAWSDQAELYTRFRFHVLKPESERRKRDLTLEEYLDDRREAWVNEREKAKLFGTDPRVAGLTARPVISVGQELLADYVDELIAAVPSPGAIVWDEIHLLGNRQRNERVRRGPTDVCPVCGAEAGKACRQGCEGTGFRKRSTERGADPESAVAGRVTRAVAAERLSRTEPALVVATTATAFDEGRPRRFWSPLDLVSPFGFGSYWDFAKRYCAARIPEGEKYWDDTGESNLDELRDRAAYFTHVVSYEEASRYLPQLRVEFSRIPVTAQLAKTDPGTREYLKEARQDKTGAERDQAVADAELSVAAVRCRRAAIDDVVAVAGSGGKAVYFTYWRLDAERTGEALREILGEKIPVYIGHGEHSDRARNEMKKAWMQHDGAAVLVGTGPAWGTGVDGLQLARFAAIQLCIANPVALLQWIGRFQRHGGVGTLVRVYVAEGTRAEVAAANLSGRLGNLEVFLEGCVLSGMDRAITGLDDVEGLRRSMLAKTLRKSEEEEDDDDEG